MSRLPMGRKLHHAIDMTEPTENKEGLDGPPGYLKGIWDLYNNEARFVDRELVKDWESTLNSLLLFVSPFYLAPSNIITTISRRQYSPLS